MIQLFSFNNAIISSITKDVIRERIIRCLNMTEFILHACRHIVTFYINTVISSAVCVILSKNLLGEVSVDCDFDYVKGTTKRIEHFT